MMAGNDSFLLEEYLNVKRRTSLLNQWEEECFNSLGPTSK